MVKWLQTIKQEKHISEALWPFGSVELNIASGAAKTAGTTSVVLLNWEDGGATEIYGHFQGASKLKSVFFALR